jgi:xanthine dehydrogenase accessory factor
VKAGHWSERVALCEREGRPYVIVTVLGARGSTPRDSGTKMVVESDRFTGTIGGGELEHRALRQARVLLVADSPAQHLENYPLGEKLGQCCGGSVSLLFEAFVPQRMPVLVFGAGHVGRALVPILATLPLCVRWVDERAAEFPEAPPEGVEIIADQEPLEALQAAPADSAFVIMTHNHPLDYALAEAALRRGDAAFVGVIGSASKARRFRLRLAHRGLTEEQIAAMQCPIGLRGVPGKQPAEIAIAVAAQLIARYQALSGDHAAIHGPRWAALCDLSDHPRTTEVRDGSDHITPLPGNPQRNPT